MINSHFNSCINNHWICPRTHWRYTSVVPHSFSKCLEWILCTPCMSRESDRFPIPVHTPQPPQELIVLAQNTSPSPTPRVLILHFSLVPPPFYLTFARLLTGLQASTILPEWLFFLKGESVTMPHHSFINLSVDSYWWHEKQSSWARSKESSQPEPISCTCHHPHPCPCGLLAFSTTGPLHTLA